MQLPQPYLYTSKRMVAIVDRAQMAPMEGLIADSVFGYHTIWAAEVPFIPAQVSEWGGNFDVASSNRLQQFLQRQIRFLYDLAQSRDHLATFEMRLISWPQMHGPTRVGVVFLGKTFHPDPTSSQQLALGLWDKFSALFPRESPFSYPLVPVMPSNAAIAAQSHSFEEWFCPLPFEQLAGPNSIVELRKYEDWPTIRDVGNVLHARDYIPHPFVAALDYSAMARLFETMARQQQITMVAVTIRPQRLTDQEVVILHELAGWYKRAPYEEPAAVTHNRLIQQWRELRGDSIETYKQTRAELGRKVYDELVREHRSLFLVRLQVVGDPIAQDDIIEALGSEVMANAGSTYPSRWTRVEAASPEEFQWARFNLQWLEFARWGVSPLIQRDRRIIRLRQLATVSEIAGAFRLPVAPHKGGLAGIDVRDEPFTLPATAPGEFDERSVLGLVMDRGVPTTVRLSLPLSEQTALLLILGDASADRETVLRQLLLAYEDMPWILLRRAMTSGQGLAQRLSSHYMLLDNAATPLPFHPFLPPPGVALKPFLDALLHVFLAVGALENATLPLLRKTLYETYQREAWLDQEACSRLDLSLLSAQIEAAAQHSTLPLQLAQALRTGCALPLQDLDLTATQFFPKASLVQPQDGLKPVVIDVSWLGSDLTNMLLYGSLWVWYSLALSAMPAVTSSLRGIVAVEDAHVLFRNTSSWQTALASLIQANAQKGVATLLIDDRPELLANEITNNASASIITGIKTRTAQDAVSTIIGASANQRARLTCLRSGEAIVKLQNMAAIQIAL
ncbi:MAG TPA: hypothetical protein VFB60_06140 [Ktedonobacteraceae bacterium]|nr:hypothetical protein [Ktedonobacteraceae bacterium]